MESEEESQPDDEVSGFALPPDWDDDAPARRVSASVGGPSRVSSSLEADTAGSVAQSL